MTFLPGGARLAANPVATGSPLIARTMGILVLACRIAWACAVPAVTIRLTFLSTSSAAICERSRHAALDGWTRERRIVFLDGMIIFIDQEEL